MRRVSKGSKVDIVDQSRNQGNRQEKWKREGEGEEWRGKGKEAGLLKGNNRICSKEACFMNLLHKGVTQRTGVRCPK